MSVFSTPTLEYTTWTQNNFGKVYLGDSRWTNRLVSLAGSMAEKPGSSLAKLGKTWHDAKAIYNLLSHRHMSPDSIQANHRHLVAKEIETAENDVQLKDS